MISVIFTGGKQYIVKAGQRLKVEKLPLNEGETASFDKVLLQANEDGSKFELGKPYLEGSKVDAKVTKQGKNPTVRVEKFKSKVRYHKVHGQRQRYTEVQFA